MLTVFVAMKNTKNTDAENS